MESFNISICSSIPLSPFLSPWITPTIVWWLCVINTIGAQSLVRDSNSRKHIILLGVFCIKPLSHSPTPTSHPHSISHANKYSYCIRRYTWPSEVEVFSGSGKSLIIMHLPLLWSGDDDTSNCRMFMFSCHYQSCREPRRVGKTVMPCHCMQVLTSNDLIYSYAQSYAIIVFSFFFVSSSLGWQNNAFPWLSFVFRQKLSFLPSSSPLLTHLFKGVY